jgi:glycosyltransferase involved in cell wall biosynthesis
MKLSIIIPAYNEEKIIGNSIQKIRQALDKNLVSGFSYEIIVCNNNSTDNTEIICKDLNVKTIFEEDNIISKARNTGASIAKGDWLLFIDADSYPKPKLIIECLLAINSGKYIGFGSTVKPDKSPFWYRLVFLITNINLRRNKTAIGAFIGCEADAFKAIGGFNEKIYYLEELDFCIRLKNYGKQQGKQFVVFYKNPLVYSGRRGYMMNWKEFNQLTLDGIKNPAILSEKKYWDAWYRKDRNEDV